MGRVFGWGLFGLVFGFFSFIALFQVLVERAFQHEAGVAVIISIMGATAIAAVFCVFAATSEILQELRESRRVIKHWQSTLELVENADRSSTQFKLGPPNQVG